MAAYEGKGRRPADPYLRIVWASKRGQGCTLSPEECHMMALDDAIATVAGYVEFGMYDETTGERIAGGREHNEPPERANG
jgi:hypothetical protein